MGLEGLVALGDPIFRPRATPMGPKVAGHLHFEISLSPFPLSPTQPWNSVHCQIHDHSAWPATTHKESKHMTTCHDRMNNSSSRLSRIPLRHSLLSPPQASPQRGDVAVPRKRIIFPIRTRDRTDGQESNKRLHHPQVSPRRRFSTLHCWSYRSCHRQSKYTRASPINTRPGVFIAGPGAFLTVDSSTCSAIASVPG